MSVTEPVVEFCSLFCFSLSIYNVIILLAFSTFLYTSWFSPTTVIPTVIMGHFRSLFVSIL